MAAITKAPFASLDANTGKIATFIAGLIAGEDLDPVSPCYISDDDGMVYMAEAADGFHGVNAVATVEGRPVTLFGQGARFSLSDGALTPGTVAGVSPSVAGGWVDNPSVPVALAVSNRDIIITTLVVVESEGS